MGNCCSSEGAPGEVNARVMHSAERRMAPAPNMAGQPVAMHHVKGTYPRVTRLQDGTLLGTLTAFANNENILVATRSTDHGQSWQPIGEVTHKPSAEHDCDNPFMLQCPSGKIICAFRDHDRQNFGPATHFRLTVCHSDDGGVTWNFLSTATEEPAGPNGIWEPFMRMSADGREVQMYFARENNDQSQNCLLIRSADEGRTWSQASLVANGGVTRVRHGMIGVAENGSPTKLFAVMETGGPNGFYLSGVHSEDDGRSWSHATKVYSPRGYRTNANAPQVVNVNGVLVASFMTEEDGGGDPGRKTKLITSHDGGKTWANNTTIGEAESKWPGIWHLGGNDVLVVHEAAQGPGAVAQRVTLA